MARKAKTGQARPRIPAARRRGTPLLAPGPAARLCALRTAAGLPASGTDAGSRASGTGAGPRLGRPAAAGGRRLLAALLACAAPALPAAAQNLAPNPLLTFSFASSLNVSDNYDLSADSPGTTTFLDNTLGVSYATETQAQSLRFGLSGVARLADLPEQSGMESRFDNQTANLDYRREGADSQLWLRGRYNRADLAFFDPLSLLEIDTPIDGEDLINTSVGYRETLNLGAGFETGLSGPLSFSLSADTRRRDFVDTEDSDLYNIRSDSVSASVGALVLPTTRLSLSGTASHYVAEDEEETDRLSRSLSLGLSHETPQALTVTGSLGYQMIDTDETDIFGRRGTTRQDGLIGSLGLSQELQNGTLGASFSHSETVNGGRSSAQIFRALDLPSGSLSLAAGVSSGETGKAAVIGDIAYLHELASGRVTLGLSRDVSTNDDDDELEVTRARIGWSHDLTAVSGLGLNLDYASTNAVAGGTDRERGRVRATYRHALTEDWDLSGGYEHTVSRVEGNDATENTVFFTIGRTFQMRP